VRYIRTHDIDLVHTHLLAADVLGRMAGMVTRRPVVSTIHNSRLDLEKEPRRRQWLERRTARLWCRSLVVVSELLQHEVAEWFGFPLERVHAIPNAVDTERFHPLPDHERAEVKRALLGANYPMIINAARLVPQKDQKTLLEAARLVIEQRPDVRFVVAGEGPLRDALVAQAQNLGIDNRVLFTGFRDDITSLLAAADVFVLSSEWEGLPVALLEAMSAGCAAVATDVGGVAQPLRHGVTGYLVPPADPAALVGALVQCLDNPARTRKMGEAARALVLQEYGARSWARKWEELYLQVLSQEGSMGAA
jgi:glycosyltransferase involved in cell wall biosynthesis